MAVKKNPFPTGFCTSGFHEGTRAKDWKGTPVKTCPFWESCPCDCHESVTKMFEMMEMPRVLQENPEYVPYKRTFWMPSDDPTYAMPEATPDLAEDGSVAVGEREVKVTATGRTQRGGLEFWVQRECLAWLLDHDPGELCTPRFLSEEIARVEGIAPPSQGAIAAVFDRWTKYGYAVIEKKPQRFERLTEQGEKMGLDWCRANAKKAAKA